MRRLRWSARTSRTSKHEGSGGVRTVATAVTQVIAICGKCGKKLGGGFGAGAGRSLSKALHHEVVASRGKRRSVRIVETKCLDICPKGAVALIDSRNPAEVLVVPRGMPLGDIALRLGLEVEN